MEASDCGLSRAACRCYVCAAMTETTTIRLPPKLRARLRAIAKDTDRSVHSIIVTVETPHRLRRTNAQPRQGGAGGRYGDGANGRDVSCRRRSRVGEKDCAGRGEPASEAVAEVIYSARALENAENPAATLAAVDAIQSAVENLAAHPLVGRRVEGDLRELVISFGATGYIALYRFVVQQDQVRVLALRHQREIGYLP